MSKLTEDDWRRVFTLRCKSKQGQTLADDERALIEAAWKENKKRYTAMERAVFVATAPFGSTVKPSDA